MVHLCERRGGSPPQRQRNPIHLSRRGCESIPHRPSSRTKPGLNEVRKKTRGGERSLGLSLDPISPKVASLPTLPGSSAGISSRSHSRVLRAGNKRRRGRGLVHPTTTITACHPAMRKRDWVEVSSLSQDSQVLR
jgi:hypothetical protein